MRNDENLYPAVVQDQACGYSASRPSRICSLGAESGARSENLRYEGRKIIISGHVTTGRRNARILLGDNAEIGVLEYIEDTALGKRPTSPFDKADSWDIKRLNRNGDQERDGD